MKTITRDELIQQYPEAYADLCIHHPQVLDELFPPAAPTLTKKAQSRKLKLGAATRSQSYDRIKPNAATKREQVLAYIVKHPCKTRRQIAEGTGLYLNSLTARVRELILDGQVEETDVVECSTTGMTVTVLCAVRK